MQESLSLRAAKHRTTSWVNVMTCLETRETLNSTRTKRNTLYIPGLEYILDENEAYPIVLAGHRNSAGKVMDN